MISTFIASILFIVALFFDWHTTKKVIDNGGKELNPLYGSGPEKSKLKKIAWSHALIVIATVALSFWYQDYLLNIVTIISSLVMMAISYHNWREYKKEV